jgi:hypothetical protein
MILPALFSVAASLVVTDGCPGCCFEVTTTTAISDCTFEGCESAAASTLPRTS